MAISRVSLSPSNTSTNYFAAGVTGAGPWVTFANSGRSPDALAHQVSIKNNTATDHSAKTLTITGFDADGRAQTEQRAAPGVSATVNSNKYYSQITSIAISATIGADTFDISYGNLVVTQTYVVREPGAAAGTYFFGVVSGTINWTVQHTATDVNQLADQEAGSWVSPNTNLSAQTATSTAAQNVAGGYQQYRVRINSYSNGATLQVW